jgi:hypothetical protein
MTVTFSVSEDLYVSIFDEIGTEISKEGPFDTFESATWWGNTIIKRASEGTFVAPSKNREEEISSD